MSGWMPPDMGSGDSSGPAPESYGRFERSPNYYSDADPGQPSQAMASWALGLSLLPCGFVWLVGAGLGIATLVRGRDGRNHGRKKAIGAICVAVLWTGAVVTVVVLAVLDDADRDSDGTVTSTGDVLVTDLRDGDCVKDPVEVTEQVTVTVTPCDEPHHAEVFADFEIDADEFPGLAEVERLAEGGCTKRLPRTLLRGPSARDYVVYYLYPNTEANFEGDRTVSCLAATTSPTTGSVGG